MAMIFWGLDIGEAMPPMFDAKAIPKMRQGAKVELTGSVRSIGCIITDR
jgi:hypothetical protein